MIYRYCIAFLVLFFSCSEEPEDCLGIENGDAQIDNCGICDSNPDNDCIHSNLLGLWSAYEINSNLSWQLTFGVDSVDVVGFNNSNMTGGTLFGQSYSGYYLINEVNDIYNEIDIFITESDNTIPNILLGIYKIEEGVLNLIYGIDRPSLDIFQDPSDFNNSSFTYFIANKI